MLKEIKKGVVMAFSFAITLGLIGVTYAAWVSISTVYKDDTLTAGLMNDIINNQNDLNSRFTPESWINASLQNGWVGNSVSGYAYDVPGYYKDSNGRVWLRGAFSGGALADNCAFTLPVGYRPNVPVTGVSTAWSSGGDANVTRVAITTSGCVKIYQQSDMGTVTAMVVDGISFSTH